MDDYLDESIVQMFFFETEQLIDQMDRAILAVERTGEYSSELINEIMRAMHTIKGSAATMKYANMMEVAHALEDVLHELRENKPDRINYSELTDLILEGSDFMKVELLKLKNGDHNDGNPSDIIRRVMSFLHAVKTGDIASEEADQPLTAISDSGLRAVRAHLTFEEVGGMENARAFIVVRQIGEVAEDMWHIPENISLEGDGAHTIRKDGIRIWFRTAASDEQLQMLFESLSNVQTLEWDVLDEQVWLDEQMRMAGRSDDAASTTSVASDESELAERRPVGEDPSVSRQSMISVSVAKLDKLMDLVGELVIAEAMVTQHPEVRGLQLDGFQKACRQLRKMTGEMQDMVMSIRMVPLAATFQKMHRIVRDMCRKLGKDVRLQFIGEQTEVDKNVIEKISDPLMHIIRNAIDHGIEQPEIRLASGKNSMGNITLEARNSGSDVYIIVRDDGRGLDKSRILERAAQNGLLNRPAHEMSDKEIYSLIFLPGFSTKDHVSQYSGRGVGMDVVRPAEQRYSSNA